MEVLAADGKERQLTHKLLILGAAVLAVPVSAHHAGGRGAMPHDEGHKENAQRRFAHAGRQRHAQEVELPVKEILQIVDKRLQNGATGEDAGGFSRGGLKTVTVARRPF